MKVKELFNKRLSNKIYNVIDNDSDDLLKWEIEPTDSEVIPDEEGNFIVIAKQTFIDKTVDCYIDLIAPERITENVIKVDPKGNVIVESIYDQENTVIPAVASDCMGIYELYYSKENPQIGIDILKTGLIKSDLKTVIAEDLGYIYRDENRVEEAIDSFLISERTNPSSEYIYQELAQLYGKLGIKAKEQEYQQKFKENVVLNLDCEKNMVLTCSITNKGFSGIRRFIVHFNFALNLKGNLQQSLIGLTAKHQICNNSSLRKQTNN